MIRNRTAILALLTGLNFLNYIDRMIVAATLTNVIHEFDLDEFQAGLLASAFLVGYFLTSPFFGARADKGPRKGLIAIGVLIWSVATVASGFAPSFLALIGARVFVGVGEASYATLAPTIIDDLTPPDKKGKALAVFYLAIPLGSAMGYMLGGFIAKHWGWRAAFYISGGPGALLALTCLLIVEPERKLAAAKGKIIDGLKVMFRILQFRRAIIGYCLYTGALGAFAFFAPHFLEARYPEYLDEQSANFWFGLVTVAAGAVGTIIGGQWADGAVKQFATTGGSHEDVANRRGINALLKICSIGMLFAAPLTLLAYFMPVPALFFALAFLIEVGLFLSTSPINAVLLRAVPSHLRASAMAAGIFAIHLLGDLWSPPALGEIVTVGGFGIGMTILGLAFAASGAVWWPRAREAA